MQDKYVGDIGDFANNGLLRALCGTWDEPVAGMRLGVVWYFNKSSGPDGNHIGYLNTSNSNNSLHRRCDKKLYDKFQELVGNSLISKKERCISQIESGRILPPDTQYFGDQVPVGDRKNWLSNALEKTDLPRSFSLTRTRGWLPNQSNPRKRQVVSTSLWTTSRLLQNGLKASSYITIWANATRLPKKPSIALLP